MVEPGVMVNKETPPDWVGGALAEVLSNAEFNVRGSFVNMPGGFTRQASLLSVLLRLAKQQKHGR